MVNIKLWNGRKRQFFKELNNPSKRFKHNPADEDLLEIAELLKKLPKYDIPESEIEILKVNRVDITQFDNSDDDDSDMELENLAPPPTTTKTGILRIFPVEYEVGMNKNGYLNMNPNRIQMSRNHQFQHNIKTSSSNNIGLLKIIPKKNDKLTMQKSSSSVNDKETQTDETLFDLNNNNLPETVNHETQVDDDIINDDQSIVHTYVKYPQTLSDHFRHEFHQLQNGMPSVRPKIFINITRCVLNVKRLEFETHYKGDSYSDNIKRKFLIIQNELLKLIKKFNINDNDDDDDEDNESINDDNNNNNNNDNSLMHIKHYHIKNYIFTLINQYFDPDNINKNKDYFVIYKKVENEELNSKQLSMLNKPHIIGPNGTKVSGRILGTIDWNKPTQATRKLLMEIFDRNTLATHSLTGKQSPLYVGNNRPIKNQLDSNKIADIIFRVRLQNSDTKEREVRGAITTKCADENKMKRYREKKRIQANLGDNFKEQKIIRIEITKRESMHSLLRKMLQ